MARNQDSNSWNQNHRYMPSSDRIMRRGDDRTRESRDWGSQEQERNSYRTDDYATDREMYRGDEDRYDRDRSYGRYGSRNAQMHGSSNFDQGSAPYTFNPNRETENTYGWSNDYRASRDYRPSYDRDYSTSSGSEWRARPSWDSSMTSDRWSGSERSESERSRDRGGHYGKGPKNYRRSDERIKEDVSDALERNPQIDASEIELDVKDGVVTLRGHIEDRRTKRLTEDVVAGIYGVKDVRNDLTVDQSIFTQARNALFGEPVEPQSASRTNANTSTATRPRH